MYKILLDENLPKKLKIRFGEGLEVLTINDLGWNAKKNGELLKLIEQEKFDYFITADKNIQYQQNLAMIGFGLIILDTKDNRYETVLTFVDEIKMFILNNNKNKIIKLS